MKVHLSDDDDSEDIDSVKPTFSGKSSSNEVNANKIIIPLEKNNYVESPELKSLSLHEVAELRERLGNIKVGGLSIPARIEDWSQYGLPDQVMSLLRYLQFHRPTAIQCQVIPASLSGRDLL